MRKEILTILALVCGAYSYAQDSLHVSDAFTLTKASIELRADYIYNGIDGVTNDDATGFKGTFFNVCLAGDISDHWSFDIRHRVAKPAKDGNFFDGTDKLKLIYKPTKDWAIAVGKHSIAVGGYDYDTAPIDLYYTGQYCIDLPCFQWGANVAYTLPKGNDKFELEMTQSPFRLMYSKKNTYGYSFRYTGNHGIINAIHSLHFFETEPGKFLNMIVLGHQLDFGKWVIEADVLSKSSLNGNSSELFFKNISLVGKVKYMPNEHWCISTKCAYDVNKCAANTPTSFTDYDYLVTPGTDAGRVGGIVEYYPLKGKRHNDIRIHGLAYYDIGNTTCEIGGMTDKQLFVSVGATWRLNFLNMRFKKN